ncbi:response regulator [Gilvimarinus agarilyticus]|uniref:response regulator n=1 Tax=unclassified Gilvimarinus TaxID=2642066 RepID=UPI001C092021|nr:MULTISPECIES: response regulator [unclassified Gilvimarinus]MBU2887419.1 response regulator [Gilvimarinus agarilyticus]MDO6572078.1 response regulator [Gilvimarinus sp. 2_MG-2023]MDO6746139.1 response regulator [Gilvimarinus sp. 1_MG-2023]
MTKILVVDDHDLVRMGIVRMLDDVNGYEVVGQAKSGEEGIAKARELTPDVVLMDVKMPGIGGLEATRKMLAANPGVKIIAVTACDDDLYPSRLLQAGAVGYVTKGTGFGDITTAIDTVVRGNQYMSSAIAQQLALKNISGQADVSPFELLSRRELETAMLIAGGRKAQDIANIFCVSSKTVNSYRYRIFEKLGINSDVELALLAVKHNYLDPEAVV